MKRALITFAVIVALGLGACAGPSASGKAVQSEPSVNDLVGRGHDARIEDLDRQIAEQMEELGLTAPTDDEMMSSGWESPALPMSDLVSTCEAPPMGDGCEDVCTTGDLICDNAQAICDLADELAPDDWAAQRCSAGRESCDRARERCCGC